MKNKEGICHDPNAERVELACARIAACHASTPARTAPWPRVGHPRCPCEPGDVAANGRAPSRRRPYRDRVRRVVATRRSSRAVFSPLPSILESYNTVTLSLSQSWFLSLLARPSLRLPLLRHELREQFVASGQIRKLHPWIPNPPHLQLIHLPSFLPNPSNRGPEPYLAGNRRFPGRRTSAPPKLHLHVDDLPSASLRSS